MAKNSTENARTRNWSFIMYPDSAPSNWKEILEDTHVNIVISPLHDKDINPGTEEYKKPHWHCLVMFDSVKTVKQAKEIADLVNGTNPILVQSLNGMVRYLIHKDNPEKAQYLKEDIINIGFFEVDDAFKNSCDKYLAIKDMITFIKENQVVEYIDFMEYCANNKFEDWFKLLCDSCSFVIQGVITSNRNKLKDAMINGYNVNEDE
ncbi:MAG: replication protein [Clostridia bacterium]|nr:replication protein [Clostridia bacterium]